jgi:hypothetical protein
MPRFIPTEEQREIVRAMAVAKKPLETIAKAILNPRTGRGIGVKVLKKLFPSELIADVELLVGFYRNIKQALDNKEVWATKYVGDHIAELKDREKDPTTPEPVKKELDGITVRFITSPHADDPRPDPANIAPAPPWPKSIEHQPTPPREPPIIDSRSEEFIRPIAQEVPDDAKPPIRNPTELKHIGDYQTEMDDPAVVEANKPFHRKRIANHDPGVTQRRLERIQFRERVRRANAAEAEKERQNGRG